MGENSTFLMMFEKILPKGKMSKRFVVYLSLILFFIVSANYFYWIDNSIFLYQENKSLFIFSSEYFQKFTIKPGGLLEYTSNFITQGYYNSVYGSLIISLFLMLLCIIVIKINKRLSADRSFSLFVILLPSCLLLLLQKSYDHFMYYNLGFLLVTLYFLFSIVSVEKRFNLIILALFPVFFYVVGSFALLYLGMYITYSIIYRKGILRYFLPAFLIIIVIFTFIVFKEALFLQPADRLLRYPLPVIDLSGFPVFLYLLCGYIILFPLFIKTFVLFKVNKNFAGTIPIVTVLTVFPVTVFLLSKNNDADLANLNHLEKSVYKQDWDAVIKQQEDFPTANLIGQYYYNLALSNKGQLCDRLFFGRQDFGAESLTLPHDNEHTNRSVYFYYTIGLIGEAHHLAYESMVRYGYSPENIKLLIKTELINEHYKVAERYINVLKKTLHYRSWAKKYEKMLYNPSLINSDPELGEKIRLLPKKDFFVRPNDVQNIELILMANPENKVAFEYKMARLMLEKDIIAVVDEVKKMKEMGYTCIPRHIEEAVVEFINLNKEFPDLGGLTVSPETDLRFKQYVTVYDLNNSGNKSWLEKEMKKVAGNTFWYYYQFK